MCVCVHVYMGVHVRAVCVCVLACWESFFSAPHHLLYRDRISHFLPKLDKSGRQVITVCPRNSPASVYPSVLVLQTCATLLSLFYVESGDLTQGLTANILPNEPQDCGFVGAS